ncbi:MAG: tetratricopeptide repeat protein, partial [bacterium]
ALDPAALKAALARAGVLLDAGHYAEARDVYAAIGRIPARPKEGWRLNNWGLCELRLARPMRARERLERSVAVFPGNPVAWNNLAVAYEQLGMENEAASAFAKGERGIQGADPQRLELVKVKLKFSVERRRWESLRR